MYFFSCWLRCLVQFPWGSLDSLQATPVNFTGLDADQFTRGRFFVFFFLAWKSFFTMENPNLLVCRLNSLPIDQSFCSALRPEARTTGCTAVFFSKSRLCIFSKFFEGSVLMLASYVVGEGVEFQRRLLHKRRKVRVVVRKGILKNLISY